MTFPERRADEFFRRYLANGVGDFSKIKSYVNEDLYEFMDDPDRIHYLNLLAERNQQKYTDHLKVCENLEGCPTNKDHERLSYFLTKELNELGVQLNDDIFTTEEKTAAEEKLEKLMTDLEEIKLSQTVTFQYIFEEMEELKKHFYLGKKKWKELFIGKGVEMAIGGVVSETISKKILSTFNDKIVPWLTNS